jgi:hypothetical protein
MELYLDSSQRIANSTTTRATFLLNRDIIRVKQISVVSASFSNLTHNITHDNNSASFGNIPVRFYTAVDFVQAVNILMGPGGLVELNETNNVLTWNLSTAIQAYSLSDVIGLSPLLVYEGSFTSILSLSRPSAISFVCTSLQNFSRQAHVQGKNSFGRALYTTHISVGYAQVQTVRESTPYVQTVNSSLSLIEILLVDPATGRSFSVNEIPQWSLILRLER